MSNRSLMEANHDFSHAIKDDPLGFTEAFLAYLRSADTMTKEPLKRFGVTVYQMRHHTDPVTDRWGEPNAD